MRVAATCAGLSLILIGFAFAAAEGRAEMTRSRGVIAQSLERSFVTHHARRSFQRRDRRKLLGFTALPFLDTFEVIDDPPAKAALNRSPNEIDGAISSPTKAIGDLPPCRETVAGVLVMRGGSCARDTR